MSDSLVFELVKNELSHFLAGFLIFLSFLYYILKSIFLNLLTLLQKKVLETTKIYAAYYLNFVIAMIKIIQIKNPLTE